MHTITLAVRIYRTSQIKYVTSVLKFKLEGLRCSLERVEAAPKKWIKVSFSGEDEDVALRYLAKEFALCPENLKNLGKNVVVRGRISGVNSNGDKLYVDIGVFQPREVQAEIPIQQLQAQLADGRKIALKKIVEIFGLCENVPLTVKISDLASDGSVKAMLAEEQRANFGTWVKSLLDRLLVLGATEHEVRDALKHSGFARDIVNVEQPGLLEHAVVCKLGTDAIGLIPKVGGNLRNASLVVFSPSKVVDFFGENFLDTF
ncbi:DUF2110 family protein [Candidatus Bathyarchaeota archaeon]|nr:DUF2110 family protein [Candidatus Bathyarchaeota archaeon]